MNGISINSNMYAKSGAISNNTNNMPAAFKTNGIQTDAFQRNTNTAPAFKSSVATNIIGTTFYNHMHKTIEKGTVKKFLYNKKTLKGYERIFKNSNNEEKVITYGREKGKAVFSISCGGEHYTMEVKTSPVKRVISAVDVKTGKKIDSSSAAKILTDAFEELDEFLKNQEIKSAMIANS